MTETVQQQTQPPVEEKKTQSENFAALRKIAEQVKAENEQLRKQLSEREEKAKAPSRRQRDEDDEDDAPYVEPKKLQREMDKMREDIKGEITKTAREQASAMLEEEKRVDYMRNNPDYDQVMTNDMLDKFGSKHPQIANSILKMPDGFERQRLVFETMKALGVHKKEEPAVQKKIDENRRNLFYVPTGSGAPPPTMAGDYSEGGKKRAYDQIQALKSRLQGPR